MSRVWSFEFISLLSKRTSVSLFGILNASKTIDYILISSFFVLNIS